MLTYPKITTRPEAIAAYKIMHSSEVRNPALIKAVKKAYRAYFSPMVESEVSYFNYSEYGYIKKYPVPEEIKTVKGAESWFEECERIAPPYSDYDCTGKLFTGWYKIIRQGDRLICYHSFWRDI